MFRLNSPRAPRTSTRISEFASHIRSSHVRLSISDCKVLSRQRQPLIVSARNASVKRDEIICRGSFGPPFTPGRRIRQSQNRLVRGALRGARRALILPTGHHRNNPCFRGPPRVPRAPNLKPRTSRSSRRASGRSQQNPAPGPRFLAIRTTNGRQPSADRNGPCRNRTYNLAIKSRLLCQLS